MTRAARRALFLAGAAGLAALLLWGLAGLPDFGDYHGPYGTILNRVAVPERHATNVVAAIVFDYRGFDTLGEEFILFTAVMAVALLLREVREEDATYADHAGSDAARLVGLALVAPTVLLGLYVVLHGVLTPGGGFQGGVLVAGGLVLVYLAGNYDSYTRAAPTPFVDAAEGFGAGAFVALGLAAFGSGAAFLHNLLGLGLKGSLLSGGSISLVNLAVGLEVAAAFVLVFDEFLNELMVERPRRRA